LIVIAYFTTITTEFEIYIPILFYKIIIFWVQIYSIKALRQMTSAVSDDSFISSIWGYINGIHITMFGVLIVIASSVYMKLRLKTLASVMLSSFVRFCINSVSYG
jgi:hypothetical protein